MVFWKTLNYLEIGTWANELSSTMNTAAFVTDWTLENWKRKAVFSWMKHSTIKGICSNKDSRKQKGYKIVSLALGITDDLMKKDDRYLPI